MSECLKFLGHREDLIGCCDEERCFSASCSTLSLTKHEQLLVGDRSEAVVLLGSQLVFVCWWNSSAFKPKPQTAAELHSRFVLTEWDALVLTHRRRAATAACRHLTTPSRPSGGGVRLGGCLEPHRHPEDGLRFRFSPNRSAAVPEFRMFLLLSQNFNPEIQMIWSYMKYFFHSLLILKLWNKQT